MRLILVIAGLVFLVMIKVNQTEQLGVPPIIDAGLAAACFLAAAMIPKGLDRPSS